MNEEVTKTQTEKKARVHKTLGEYKKVIVGWKQPNKVRLDIFVSINDYTITFKPDIEVEVPQKIIDFLKEATYEEHFFDETDKKHKSRPVRKYSVETV